MLRAAAQLHQGGDIPANTYVLDLDVVGANAALIAAEARRLGLQVFAMTKQIGRNPVAITTLLANGIPAGVAVDMGCARALTSAGARLGHVGHLVQVPRYEAVEAASMAPTYWTVFSVEKAREASAAARERGRSQPLLARVYRSGDQFYPGHEGGFDAERILDVAEKLGMSAGGSFAGITSFPALLFDAKAGRPCTTPNLATLQWAREQLEHAGYENVQVNAPGTTSTRALSVLADAGATQVEPGHALTGTTPWHAVEDLPELPAMVYVSEVSHVHGDRSFCYGGGLYIDPVFPPYDVHALVGTDADEALSNRVRAILPASDSIDYYGQLDVRAGVGATVLFGFRAQAFVTRAFVAPVSGIQTGQPEVQGLWTAGGMPAEISLR